jgi:hypothetical protein
MEPFPALFLLLFRVKQFIHTFPQFIRPRIAARRRPK